MSDKFHDVYRLSTAQSLAVQSVGGAATSSAAINVGVRSLQLSFPGSTSVDRRLPDCNC